MSTSKKLWLFDIGDVVLHKELGVGMVKYRTTASVHEMARPVRIVDKEVYSVLFGKEENILSSYGEDLSLVSSYKLVER